MPSKKDTSASGNTGVVMVRVLKRGHTRISKGQLVPGTFQDDTYSQGDEFETTPAIAAVLEERDFVEIKS